MASPRPIAPMNGWNQQTMPPQNNNDFDESGLQVRPMGLKVHYTFDKEGKVNCLARYPQTIHVQTIPLDEKTSIGVVDLRVCIRAVTECSPELAGQDGDYTVYALDYSEPDTPLVGQGMLSWALDSMRNSWDSQPPKMVTGRVTKNLMAVFGGGNRETLEVKLKLTGAAKVQRPEPPQLNMEMQPMRPMETVMTPTGTSEWNSFIQANPQLGHSAHVSRVASPALSQGPPMMMNRRDSFGPNVQGIPPQQEVQRIAPVPVDPNTLPPQPATSSRPSSRASRKRAPTGRPRGRPRKKPAEGNTSGYEDGTEGEEGPAKKRAKTTKVEKAAPNPFGAGPESLRVAASTSGSIRNFRPIGNNEVVTGNHLQEVPRAPTPVPEGGPMGMPPRAKNGSKIRRESSMNQELNANKYPQKPKRALSPSQEDGRSPESDAPTPNYSEDSPQNIGSSPPVPRTTPYMQSSPPPSSPMLPPMPQSQLRQDSSFTNDEIDCLFDEVPFPQLEEQRKAPNSPLQTPQEVKDCTGIPTQVFQLQNGPDGQEIVHIQNYNTPQPTSTPAAPLYHTEAPSLPPLRKESIIRPRPTRAPPNNRAQQPTPPTLVPTPPTTDAIEKAPSPAPAPEPTPEVAEPALPTEPVKEDSPMEPTPSPEQATVPPQETLPVLPPPPNPPKPRTKRNLARSQSASVLALPCVPASEPVGPSSLSQTMIAEPPRPSTEAPSILRRAASIGPLSLPIPASDPVVPAPATLPPPEPFSEAPCGSLSLTLPEPFSEAAGPLSPPCRSNKNQVKKQSIKQRLELAIQNGVMPPFCTNCGAINTPTWRKIWIQDHDGVPEYVEYSEKPGRITAIDILQRDEEEKPVAYRLIKKSLGNDDDKTAWLEQLLCNPCGIWLTKYRTHRPQNKWDNSFGPLGQDRRKRSAGPSNSRSKKARTKSDSQMNPTSDAYFATDPLGPIPSSPKFGEGAPLPEDSRTENGQSRESEAPAESMRDGKPNDDVERRSNPGSTHSRGSGTARSPIAIDMDNMDEELGNTRRLLFPSPKKDGQLRVLGELSVNIVQTGECRQNKELVADKENVPISGHDETTNEHDDLEALFRSPAARPSTPPPDAKAAAHATPFKTPTRPTPSHRPITRSVSRSLRSIRGMASPEQLALLQRTPTKTPRGSLNGILSSASRRRSPRNHQVQVNFDHFFDTPITRAINQVLSEPNFDLGNSGLDLSSLPDLDANHESYFDFGNLLSTDPAGMPSSPPKNGLQGLDFSAGSDIWKQWAMGSEVPVEDNEE
ncbi:Fc.00g050890.m01.CDS01 [Cosmosporella sp. VM-42]